jgi:hypothetical protein
MNNKSKNPKATATAMCNGNSNGIGNAATKEPTSHLASPLPGLGPWSWPSSTQSNNYPIGIKIMPHVDKCCRHAALEIRLEEFFKCDVFRRADRSKPLRPVLEP